MLSKANYFENADLVVKKKQIKLSRREIARRIEIRRLMRKAEQMQSTKESSEDNINAMNALPIVSQLKSVVLLVTGNIEETIQVQADFVTTCPVVSQVTSGIQLCKGDTEGAKKSWRRFCRFMGELVNSIPVIGHLKAVYHKIMGDNVKAKEAFLAATRTSAVFAGGILCVFGGEIGMIVGAIAAGIVVDGIVTLIHSWDGKYRPHGMLAELQEMKDDPTVGGLFDIIANILLDGLSTWITPASMKYAKAKPIGNRLRRFYGKKGAVHLTPLPTKVRSTGAGVGGGRKKHRQLKAGC